MQDAVLIHAGDCWVDRASEEGREKEVQHDLGSKEINHGPIEGHLYLQRTSLDSCKHWEFVKQTKSHILLLHS